MKVVERLFEDYKLLYEKGRPIEVLFLLMAAELDRRDLIHFYALLMAKRADLTAMHLQQSGFTDHPSLKGHQILPDVFRSIVYPSYSRKEEIRARRGSMRELVDGASAELDELRLAYRRSVARYINKLEKHTIELRSAAMRAITFALKEDPVESRDSFSSSMSLFREALTQKDAVIDPTLWLAVGWLRWKIYEDLEEATQAFSRACLHSARERGAIFSLASRTLAHLQAEQGDYDKAYSTAVKAIGVFSEPEGFLEAIRYAHLAGKSDETMELVLQLVEMQPLAILWILGEEELKDLYPSIAELATSRLQAEIHKALHFLNTWETSIQRLKEVERQTGIPLLPPANKQDSPASLRDSLEQASLFDVMHFRLVAEQRSAGAFSHAHDLLARKHYDKASEVEDFRAKLESTFEARKSTLKEAKDKFDRIEQESNVRLTSHNIENGGAQKGCMVGFSAGCGIFMIYVIAAIILGTTAAIGPETLLGQVCLALALLPVSIGGLIMLLAVLKLHKIQAEVSAVIYAAQSEYHRTAIEIDLRHKPVIQKVRTKLAEAEKELHKLDEALKLLSAIRSNYEKQAQSA